MAISSEDSASNAFVKAGSTPQSSRNSSSQSKDSSASWSAPPSLETNSSSERAREASRTCAATEVPERSNCLPSTRTSSRPLGSFTNSRIVAAANFFVRSRNSTVSRPWFISAFCFPNFYFSERKLPPLVVCRGFRQNQHSRLDAGWKVALQSHIYVAVGC